MTPTLGDYNRGAGNDDYTPAEGIYDVTTVDAEAFESKAGNLIAKLVLAVTPGHPDAGQRFDAIFSFPPGNDRVRAMASHNLSVAGLSDEQLDEIDPDDFQGVSSLDRALRTLVGRGLQVKAKARDGGGVWVDVISSRNGTGDVQGDLSDLKPQASQADDSIPF